MKYLFSCVFFFCGFLLFSQNKEVLYGLDETPQSLMLNPGTRIVNKFHFGIPLMSHFHFNGGSSGVSAYDIFKHPVSISILELEIKYSNWTTVIFLQQLNS
jgi:hypothetical protein